MGKMSKEKRAPLKQRTKLSTLQRLTKNLRCPIISHDELSGNEK